MIKITMKHESGDASGVVRISANGKPVFTVGDGWLFVSVLSVLEGFTYTAGEIEKATEAANKYILNYRKKF